MSLEKPEHEEQKSVKGQDQLKEIEDSNRLKPDQIRELEKQSESLRREIVEVERKKQERDQITEITPEEAQALQEIQDRRIAKLQKKMDAVTAELGNVGLPTEMVRNPEDDVLGTSKELLPDLTKESAGSDEVFGEEFQDEWKEDVKKISTELLEEASSVKMKIGAVRDEFLARSAVNSLRELSETIVIGGRRPRIFDSVEEAVPLVARFEDSVSGLEGEISSLQTNIESLAMSEDYVAFSERLLQGRQNIQNLVQDIARAKVTLEELSEVGERVKRWADENADILGYEYSDEILRASGRLSDLEVSKNQLNILLSSSENLLNLVEVRLRT